MVSLTRSYLVTKLSCHRYDFTNAFVELLLMNGFCKDNTDELSAAREEQIGFDGFRVSSFDVIQSKGFLKNVDGSLNENAVLVKIVHVFLGILGQS